MKLKLYHCWGDRDGNKEVALGTSKIVSTLDGVCIRTLLTQHRTTLILVSLSSFPRSLMCRLRSSSPRLSATSSDGPSSRSKMRMTGPSSSTWTTPVPWHTKRLLYFDLQLHFILLFLLFWSLFFLFSCKNTRPGGALNTGERRQNECKGEAHRRMRKLSTGT